MAFDCYNTLDEFIDELGSEILEIIAEARKAFILENNLGESDIDLPQFTRMVLRRIL